MISYTLQSDGDDLEKACKGLFLDTEFQQYELFWTKFVIPLTNRPTDIHFKTDAELQLIGKSKNDICIAQLHYTILRHLARVYELRTIEPISLDQFIEAMTRLLAALDVADELLERNRNNSYDAWSESEGKKAREKWRHSSDPLKHLRQYRNHLVHGRVQPAIVIQGTYIRFRVPKFGKEQEYLDWRKVTSGSIGSGGKIRTEFDSPNNLINQAWIELLQYLESSWKQNLTN